MVLLRTLPTESDSLLAAIGDVHGRADLLEPLLRALEAEASTRSRPLCIVLLGDLIDRGPDSRRVLDLASDAFRRHPGSVFLLGNHDDYLKRLFDGTLETGEFEHWLGQGGAETLLSYGIDSPSGAGAARDVLLASVPDHRAFLDAAEILVEAGPFAFVHAGIDPARPLAGQTRHDCLWIRRPFQDHRGPLPRIVVHGHQPQRGDRPTVTENRISLDTGAVHSGILAALLVDERERRLDILATRPEGGVARLAPRVEDRGFGTALDGWRVNAA